LPPGAYEASLDELFAAYPPINQQRQILNDSFRFAVEALPSLDPSLIIFVDGSFVTRKAEPNDVDLLIITVQYTEPGLAAYLDHICPGEAVSLDVNVEPQQPNRLLTLFTTTRTGRDKGIILLV
jgi:hypothetical protein